MIFANLIFDKFNPLLSEFNFTANRFSDEIIKFTSSKMIVTFSYDKRSHEIGFTTKLINGDHGFDIFEICKCLTIQNHTLNSFVQIEENSIPIWVSELYLVLNKHTTILNADFSLYDCLKTQKENIITDYNSELALKWTMEEAKVAWETKNYRRYIELVSPIEAQLKGSEKKKLAIALKRL
jgi:hypothetical protein